jgi:hypothetical protein
LNWRRSLQAIDLGRDPYPIELDELVEKEIAAVIFKNEERKKKKGKEKRDDITATGRNEVDDRLLFLEDFVDKWVEKLEIWDRMIIDLQEGAQGEPLVRMPGKGLKDISVSNKLPSKVCVPSHDSGDEEESIHVYTDDDSNGEANSKDWSDVCPGKSVAAGPSHSKGNAVTGVEVEDSGGAAVRSHGQDVMENEASESHRAGSAKHVFGMSVMFRCCV